MDRFEISELRSYYGALLTPKQDEILRMRYDEDMSFGEIAEALGISRQTVLDTVTKGEKHLIRIDEALKLRERDAKIAVLLEQIRVAASSDDDGDVLAAVNKIKRIMEE